MKKSKLYKSNTLILEYYPNKTEASCERTDLVREVPGVRGGHSLLEVLKVPRLHSQSFYFDSDHLE